MSKQPLMIVVVAVVLAGAACNNDGDQPSTDGSEPAESSVPYQGPPVGTYNAGYSEFIAPSGYLQLMTDGTGRVLSMDGERPTEGLFEYRTDGDRLVVTSGEESTWDCDPAEPGIYEWARVESVLELEPVDESCDARAAAMQPEFGPGDPMSWWSMGDVPIVEMRPGDDPVTVETPIGTIEWALVEEQPSLSWLTTFDDGFVALASAEVVVSVDGSTWTPLPPPPVVPEWLGTRGGEVWVASGTAGNATTWPPSIYVTDDNGSNWKEVAVDPAPPGVEPRATGAAAGPRGTVITTQVADPAQGPLLWVLGTESFEPVTTPFEGTGVFVSVRALDSGFVANTYRFEGGQEVPGSFWTSPDGRSWTEGADAPSGFRFQGTYGDTVYGVIEATGVPNAVEFVTSLDGGRTWQPAPPRPSGGLDVSDIGLVAVESGGWLCYGNAFVSSDGSEWARALSPWPLTGLGTPFISGDTILIPAYDCMSEGKELHWIGTLVEASATTNETVRP